MRYLFIYNPVSGRENSRTTKLGNILMKLGQNGNEILVYQTQDKGDARRYLSLVKEQYDMIIIRKHEMHRVFHNSSTMYRRFVLNVSPEFFIKKD